MMMLFGFWLLAGFAIGMILMAFLAIGTYQRGYNEGYFLRKPWRAELGARRTAFANVYQRGIPVAVSSHMSHMAPMASSLAEPVPLAAASSG